MSDGPMYVLYVAIIVYCLVATYGDLRRFMPPTRKGQHRYRVTSRGREVAIFGAVLGIFAFLLSHGSATPVYFALGLAAGTVGGAALSFHTAAKWRIELDRQGASPLEIRRKTHLGIPALIFLLLALWVLAPLLPNSPPKGFAEISTSIGGALSGFFFTSGIYTWAWGRRREREGLKPFEITVHKQ